MLSFIVTGGLKYIPINVLMLRESVHVLFACMCPKPIKQGAQIDGPPW